MKFPLRLSLWLSVLALLVLTVFAILESRLSPYDPLAVQFMPLDPPSFQNLFGTDDLGRDVFSRFVSGARISFVVGLTSVFFALLMGTVMGLAAAYFKPIQALVMRIVDAIWAFPMHPPGDGPVGQHEAGDHDSHRGHRRGLQPIVRPARIRPGLSRSWSGISSSPPRPSDVGRPGFC